MVMMNDFLKPLAVEIYNASHLHGVFTLRSGLVVNDYFDKYNFEANPVLLGRIAYAMLPLVPPGPNVLGGLELGGIPIAVALSQKLGMHLCFIRKVRKTYGTCNLVEGCKVKGKSIAVIEDVTTTGGDICSAVNNLRSEGAIVRHAVTVIDRQQGAKEKLKKNGVILRSLFTLEELEKAREETK